MNKSISEARKLMSVQKVAERSDNKVVALAIKTHAPISGCNDAAAERGGTLVGRPAASAPLRQIRCA